MKTILLPFSDEDAAEVALETALIVADRFGSYVEGLFAGYTPQIAVGDGMTIPPEYLTQVTDEWRRRAVLARERFDRVMQRRDVPAQEITVPSERPTAGWRETQGLESPYVGDFGRLFDLIVIGRTGDQAPAAWETTCEAALFESGRPVLVAGSVAPAKLGELIVIAWNGSSETARTIALAMPLLAAASKVVVLTVEGGTVPGPSGVQVAQHLARNDIDANAITVGQDGRLVGEAILAEVGVIGVDLLIKGAYTRHRLRQMIFGGATRYILSNATIPVLLAH